MAKALPVAAVVLPRESRASVRSRRTPAGRHLGNAAGVIGHRAIGVSGEGDAQRGQHADAGNTDAVEALVEGVGEGARLIHDDGGAAGGKVAHQHGRRHNEDGRSWWT